MDNLIKIYEKTIPKEVCDFIINEFETSKNQMEGISGAGVNKLVKSSTDLMIHLNLNNPNWLYIYDYLRENLLGKNFSTCFIIRERIASLKSVADIFSKLPALNTSTLGLSANEAKRELSSLPNTTTKS
jgi:hypothetical protein